MFLSFPAENISEIIPPLTFQYVVLIEAIIVYMLSFIGSIKKLAIVSLVSNILIIVCFMYIIIECFIEIRTIDHGKVDRFNFGEYSLFLGTSFFAFEGIGTMIPIKQSMKNKSNFSKILAANIVVIFLFFTTVALIGYHAFGNDVKGPITLNLLQSSNVNKIARASIIIYSIATTLTFPLVAYPSIEIAHRYISKYAPEAIANKFWVKAIVRLFFVLVCVGITLLTDGDSDKYISVVGSLVCIPLTFMLPPLFHVLIVSRTRNQMIFDLVLLLLGTSVCIISTVFTILEWAQEK